MRKYIIILISIVIITFGGIYMKHQHDKKEAETELFNKAKEEMATFIEKNYQDIDQINFSDSYKIDPMGGITVEGYLNSDKNKEFFGTYDKANDEIGISSVDAEEKPECQDKVCK
ncbi:DUF1433 domain-containing protein [Bacillus swezeyi]|uniref:DUF1433 domain-containing protein n=1 Tax=Bacillus swezeyi TaxID=1925020 RepID=UPI002E1C391C|nr:DUF1433 domain-containing protein [Bacillus swezeyi]